MAELLRVGSAGVIGVEFLDAEHCPGAESISLYPGKLIHRVGPTDSRPHVCTSIINSARVNAATALRAGAARYTVGGQRQSLQLEEGNSVGPGLVMVPSSAAEPNSSLQTIAAALRQPVTTAFGSAFGVCQQLPTVPTSGQTRPGLAPWGEASFGSLGSFGADCSMLDCLPASPARGPADGLTAPAGCGGDALSWAFLQSQNPQQDQLITRPGLSFSEHPCTLLRAQSGGGGSGGGATLAATATLAAPASAAPLQSAAATATTTSEEEEEQEEEAVEAPAANLAAVPTTSSPSLVSQPSLSASTGVVARPCSSDVNSLAPSSDTVDAADAAVDTTQATGTAPVGPPGTAALKAARGALAAPAALAGAARGGLKRRAAATAAAAVLEVASRDDDEDDEDYDERLENGGGIGSGAGGNGAKRVKKGAGTRQTASKAKTGVTCRNCNATTTPQWRCGPEGPRTLCNACGVRYKKGQALDHKQR